MVQNTLRGPEWRKIQVSMEVAVELVDLLNIDLPNLGFVGVYPYIPFATVNTLFDFAGTIDYQCL